MKIEFDPQQNYDCLQCGRGCQAGWDIAVEPEVVERLRHHALTRRIEEQGQTAFLQLEDRILIHNSRECPDCRFLNSDKLCSIHRDLGYQAKPATCQLFPFVVTRTPEGYFAGTTYFCSATRQNHGRPSQVHREDLQQQLQRAAPINVVADDGLVVYGRYTMTYQEYLGLERDLLARAEEVGYSQALAEWTWGLTRLLAPLPDLEEDIREAGHLFPRIRQELSHFRGQQLAQINGGQLADYLMFQLDRELWDDLERGLSQPTSFALPQFDWVGRFSDLLQLQDPRFDAQIESYLRHLIWRKALVVHPHLLVSLVQLQFLPMFLRVTAGLMAHRQGQALGQDHYFQALTEAETYLVTHGRNRRVIHEMGAELLIHCARRASAATGGNNPRPGG